MFHHYFAWLYSNGVGASEKNVAEGRREDIFDHLDLHVWVIWISKSKYFIILTGDFSRILTIMCMKSKDEPKSYISKVRHEKDKKLKWFQAHNEIEFCKLEFLPYFSDPYFCNNTNDTSAVYEPKRSSNSK